MKRLNLKSLKLQADELLRNELMTITGGYDDCNLSCQPGCEKCQPGCQKRT